MKNSVHKILCFLFLLCVVLSCSSDDDASETPIGVQYNSLCGITVSSLPNEYVNSQRSINSSSELNNFIHVLQPYNFNLGCFNSNEFDFENFTILLLVDSVRPHTGHDILIESILEYRDKVIVKFKTVSTDIGFSAIIIPIRLYKINKTNKPILFIDITP